MARKKTFEDALARLEEIAHQLEEGDLSLEEALGRFDEGVKLAEFCAKKLDEAQQKVDILVKKSGRMTSQPFQPEAAEPREGE